MLAGVGNNRKNACRRCRVYSLGGDDDTQDGGKIPVPETGASSDRGVLV